MAPSTYSDAMVKEKGVARSANARANKVNGQYLTKALKLDMECFSSEPDVEARSVLRKLRSYPRVRGQCVGAFAECFSVSFSVSCVPFSVSFSVCLFGSLQQYFLLKPILASNRRAS
jgi:hypothetical protein